MSFITQEQILKVLVGFNPWWSTEKIPSNLTRPVKRLAFYEGKKIYYHPQIRREIILSGPRRVGKTTIMYQMMEELIESASSKQILYVSFNHPMLKLSNIGEIIEVFENNISSNTDELYLFFDEIQYAPDWDTWLKTLYDQHPQYKILATGSASPVISTDTFPRNKSIGDFLSVKRAVCFNLLFPIYHNHLFMFFKKKIG